MTSTAPSSHRSPRHPLPHRVAPAGPTSFGDHLRTWRQQRHLSQLELADEADISTRHVSFMETGRTNPSRDMVLRLCERLAIPLRERNALLVAAGYAPMYRERALDDPALAAARQAVELVLKGHEPCPAIALDRCWNVVATNRAALALLSAHVSPELLAPPVNVFRLSLHPQGLAPRIANLAQWRAHLFERLRQQIQATADPALIALQAELLQYPAPPESDALVLAGEMVDEMGHYAAGDLIINTPPYIIGIRLATLTPPGIRGVACIGFEMSIDIHITLFGKKSGEPSAFFRQEP